MSTSLTRRIAVPAVAAALLVAASCSSGGDRKYGPDGYVAVTNAESAKPDKPLDTDGADQPGRLTGPHYSFQLAGYSTTDHISVKEAASYGFGSGPVRAKDGTEFFLAIMSDKGFADSGSVASATLSVDGKEKKLDRVPGPGEGVAAMIPDGAEVLLSIEDEKRTQTLNLSDGTRPEQIPGFYNAGARTDDLDNYAHTGKATGDAGADFLPVSRKIDLTADFDEATRSPWFEGEGWADDGMVWMAVSMSSMTTNSVWGFDTSKDSHEPIMIWKLKERDTFSLNPDAGSTAAPEGNRTFVADDSRNPYDDKGNMDFDPSSATLLFEVSQNATEAVLKVTPDGSLKAKWADVTGDCGWDSRPATEKITVKF